MTDAETRPVAVFGAGTLGRRIAAVLAGHGAVVRLFDISEQQLREAEAYVRDVTLALPHRMLI